MTTPTGYRWHLRERLGARGIWKTTELVPLLAEHGVELSSAQVYRLVAKVPERLSLHVLAALCSICSCSPSDLIEVGVETDPPPPTRRAAVVTLPAGRPRRARVDTSAKQ